MYVLSRKDKQFLCVGKIFAFKILFLVSFCIFEIGLEVILFFLFSPVGLQLKRKRFLIYVQLKRITADMVIYTKKAEKLLPIWNNV